MPTNRRGRKEREVKNRTVIDDLIHVAETLEAMAANMIGDGKAHVLRRAKSCRAAAEMCNPTRAGRSGEAPANAGGEVTMEDAMSEMMCNCGKPLDGSHDHVTCGPPIPADPMACACKSDDPYECYRRRYPDEKHERDERCECCCHAEYWERQQDDYNDMIAGENESTRRNNQRQTVSRHHGR